MPTLPNRKVEFRELFLTKPWVTDGAMATMLFAKGAPRHRAVEDLNLTLAPLVRDVHREFLAAGAEIIRTNTFGGNRIRLAKAGLDAKLNLVNQAAVRIAREAAQDRAFVAGTIGSTGETLDPLGTLGRDEACDIFKQQAAALDGVDLIVLETFRDVAELRSAVCGVREAAGSEIVVIAHVTVNDSGNLHDGTPPERFGPAISALPVDAIGVNCSSGPHAVAAVIERLRKVTSKPLSAIPSYDGDAAYFAERLAETGAAVVGGCCGTTPEHIQRLKETPLEVRQGQDAEAVDPEPQKEVPLAKRSKLGAKLAAKKFVDDKDLESLVTIDATGRGAKQLQEELLAIHERGDRNILCHSHGIEYLASQLNRGLDMGGNSITQTSFVIGTEPFFDPHADFLVSPPIFDIEELPKAAIPVIATVATIPDARTAEYWIHERGADIPEDVLARMNNGEGEAVAEELTKALRKTAAGVRRYTRT